MMRDGLVIVVLLELHGDQLLECYCIRHEPSILYGDAQYSIKIVVSGLDVSMVDGRWMRMLASLHRPYLKKNL